MSQRCAKHTRKLLLYGFVMATEGSEKDSRIHRARIPAGVIITVGGPVWVEDETLRWTWDWERIKWSSPPKNLIDSFAALWKKNRKDVIAFVEKMGPLRVDEYCLPVLGEIPESEPLAAWWFLSRRAHAILRIAGALRKKNAGDPEDWKFISKDTFFAANSDTPERLEAIGAWPASRTRREKIAREASSWLARFRVDLRIKWNRTTSSWGLEISYGNSLINAISLQLALAVANVEGLFTCNGCGIPYIRENRSPNKGQANYCPDCGSKSKRIPQRMAEARYREKRRNARRAL